MNGEEARCCAARRWYPDVAALPCGLWLPAGMFPSGKAVITGAVRWEEVRQSYEFARAVLCGKLRPVLALLLCGACSERRAACPCAGPIRYREYALQAPWTEPVIYFFFPCHILLLVSLSLFSPPTPFDPGCRFSAPDFPTSPPVACVRRATLTCFIQCSQTTLTISRSQ